MGILDIWIHLNHLDNDSMLFYRHHLVAGYFCCSTRLLEWCVYYGIQDFVRKLSR